MTKKIVTCVSCGKTGEVEINKINQIVSEEFWYFGKIQTNSMYTEEYTYQLDMERFEYNDFVTKKVKNPRYDPNAKPIYKEYWECSRCCHE